MGEQANNAAMRAYLHTLREGRNMTQDEVAEGIEFTTRTYSSWEAGETQSIKEPYFLRAVLFLGGTLGHAKLLTSKNPPTEVQARKMAQDVLDNIVQEDVDLPEDVRDLIRYFERELATLRESDRMRLGPVLRAFLAGYRSSAEV